MNPAKLIAFASYAAIHATLAVEDGMAPPPLAQGHIRDVALDFAGNRYVAGFFFGAVDFNPGAGLDAKTSAGESDLFVTRFNADGSYAWTGTFGGSAGDQAAAVAVGGTSVFVTGGFASTDARVPNAGGMDAIVLAFDTASGAPVANFGNGGAQTFGGAGEDEATALVFAGRTLYVAGGYTSTNATVGGAEVFASAGDEDAFVLALNAVSGKPMTRFGKSGLQALAGLNLERATGLAFTGRTLFVVGYVFAGSTGIGQLGGLTGLGGLDAFVMALSGKTGKPVKRFGADGVQLVGGTGNDLAFGVAAANGGLYVCGTFDSSDAGVNALGDARSAGGFDAFVAALNPATGVAHPFFGISGFQTFGGSEDDAAATIAVVGERLHLGGVFTSGDAGIGGSGTIESGGGGDGFVLQIDSFTGGAFDFAPTTFGGFADDAVFALVAARDKVFAAGSSFSSDAGIGGSGNMDALPWNGFVLPMEASGNDIASLTNFDRDGDGFPDEVEAALRTPPDQFIYSPAGFDAGPAGRLTVRSLTIKLDFATPDPVRDRITLRGKVSLPADFASAGQPVALSVGGVVWRFVLNAHGVAASGASTFKLTTKPTGVQVPAHEANFVATLNRASVRLQLDDEGLTSATTIPKPGEPRVVAVIVVIGGKFFRSDVNVSYTAVASQSGQATGP